MVDEIKLAAAVASATIIAAGAFLVMSFNFNSEASPPSSSSSIASKSTTNHGLYPSSSELASSSPPIVKGENYLNQNQQYQQTQLQTSPARKNTDPVATLKQAYSLQASSEVEHCLDSQGQLQQQMLCDSTMTMLAQSCKDPSMYISACDDQRVREYAAQLSMSNVG